MKKMTKANMIEKLQEKGIHIPVKYTREQVLEIYAARGKSLAMGNRTGEYYFGTKRGTHAGRVARAIAHGEVTSTADIRKKVETKYSFRETLHRLATEGIIKFTDAAHRQFELTTKGRELAAMYKSSELS